MNSTSSLQALLMKESLSMLTDYLEAAQHHTSQTTYPFNSATIQDAQVLSGLLKQKIDQLQR